MLRLSAARARKSALMLIILVLTAVLAACSAGSSDNSAAAGKGSTEEIVFGVTGPLTGDNAEYGKLWKKGFDLALDEINGKGGVKGRKLTYLFEDSQSDPKQTPAVAQKFVANSRIIAVLGDFSSGSSMAASPIYQRAGIVQLGITNSHPDFTKTGDYIWSNSASQKDEAPYLATVAVKDLGKQKLAVLYQNTDWGKSSTELFTAKAKDLGADIVLQEGYVTTEKDFRPVLTKVRDAKPDLLVLISYYNDASLIAQQLKAVGLNVPAIGASSLYSPQLIKLGGDAVEGIMTITRFHPGNPDPAVQAFVKAYKAKYGEDPDSFSAVAYDGVKILATVLEKYGVDRKALRDGLADIKELDTVLYGKSAFGDDRRLKDPKFLPLVVKNGTFEVWKP